MKTKFVKFFCLGVYALAVSDMTFAIDDHYKKHEYTKPQKSKRPMHYKSYRFHNHKSVKASDLKYYSSIMMLNIYDKASLNSFLNYNGNVRFYQINVFTPLLNKNLNTYKNRLESLLYPEYKDIGLTFYRVK